MSNREWAAIVYGRSYHLDFRFITLPQDFQEAEITWALPYILATTQKARNLANAPRWSLFKNHSHCVVGVTCMVRDLIDKLSQDLMAARAKDNLGRPLYIFVGYVTQLNNQKSLANFPAYTGSNLASFKSLYQEIEKVWLAKDYDNRQPFSSKYKLFDNSIEIATVCANLQQVERLNHQTKCPEHTFIWQQSPQKDSQLWLSSAQCQKPTSVCLNIKEKSLLNSPFLNQTITNIDKFAIQDRINKTTNQNNHRIASSQPHVVQTKNNFLDYDFSLKEKISLKAREDLDLTIKQATKISLAGQEMINHLGTWSCKDQEPQEKSELSALDQDDFGFKNKKTSLPSQEQDWF